MYKSYFFGILRDVLGCNTLEKEVINGTSLAELKKELTLTYPEIQQYQNYAIAVNEAYSKDNYTLQENDVLALIPPVSGG